MTRLFADLEPHHRGCSAKVDGKKKLMFTRSIIVQLLLAATLVSCQTPAPSPVLSAAMFNKNISSALRSALTRYEKRSVLAHVLVYGETARLVSIRHRPLADIERDLVARRCQKTDGFLRDSATVVCLSTMVSKYRRYFFLVRMRVFSASNPRVIQ